MSKSTWTMALAALLCLTAFFIQAGVLRAHLGFPLDDSWIHQNVARNLVSFHILGYLPGTPSSGSSSLLWTLILATKFVLFPGLSPVLFCLVVNALLLVSCSVLLTRQAQRDGLPSIEVWIFGVAPVLSGNFLWLAFTGMEHVLFVALSLSVVFLWFAGNGTHRTATLIASSLALLLLGLTRPEGIFLLLPLLLVRSHAARSWKQCTAPLVAVLVAEAVSTRVNWLASQTLLPLTMKGRQWLFLGPNAGLFSHRLIEAQIVQRIIMNWTAGLVIETIPVPELNVLFGCLFFAAIVALAWLYYRERRYRTSVLLVWMALLNVIYSAILPTAGQGGRYQPFQLLLAIPVLALGLLRLAPWLAARGASAVGAVRGEGTPDRLAAAAVVVLLIVSTVVSNRFWRSILSDGIDQINVEHGQMAEWVPGNIPAGAITQRQLAVFDIGRIGYEIQGSLLDLGGLTDPAFLPYLMKGDVLPFLRERRIAYLILPETPSADHSLFRRMTLKNSQQYTLEPLQSFCAPPETVDRVKRITGAAMGCQIAYLIRYR